MSRIVIGAHVIGNFVDPNGWQSLLPDWFGHLFLIFSEDDEVTGADQIIRGGQADGALIVQQGVSWAQSADGIDFWSGPKGSNTGANAYLYYGYADANFGDWAASPLYLNSVWQTLNNLASQIDANQFAYSRISQNSNSLIGNMLHVVGLNFPIIENQHGNTYFYPGSDQSLSYDFESMQSYSYSIQGGYFLDSDGKEVLVNDRLFAISDPRLLSHTRQGDHLSGFGGDDELHDGNRMDTL